MSSAPVGREEDVRPLELVRLVARESQAERDPAVVLEIAQDSRRSALGNEECDRLPIGVHDGADHPGVGGAEVRVPRPDLHERRTVQELDDPVGDHANIRSGGGALHFVKGIDVGAIDDARSFLTLVEPPEACQAHDVTLKGQHLGVAGQVEPRGEGLRERPAGPGRS